MYNLVTDCSASGLVKLLWCWLFQTPVVVDTDHMANDFDLITNNEHLHESEVRQECYSDAHSVINKTKTKKITESFAGCSTCKLVKSDFFF